jgi:hypothetical protein
MSFISILLQILCQNDIKMTKFIILYYNNDVFNISEV